MPNHDRFECQTAIDSDAILQLTTTEIRDNIATRQPEQLAPAAPAETTDGARYQILQFG